MPFYSPLRYPGGKGRLGAWMADLLRANGISGGWYAEPYAGGAGVALHLLLEGYVRRIFINDLDPAIHAFWRTVLDDPEGLTQKIHATSLTVRERDRQQAILQNQDRYTLLEVGFATLYVNRTSRSGILNGGVIGGREQIGRWKMDARYYPETISERIRRISRFRNKIELSNKDAVDFLDTLPADSEWPGLVYLDPPYFHNSGRLYKSTYIDGDHGQLAERVRRLNQRWVVTYDDTLEVEELYSWAPGGRFSIYYTANSFSRRTATELIYCGGIDLKPAPYSRR